MHENIQNKNDENVRLQTRLRELQGEFEYKITQINQEWQLKITSYEQRITILNRENEEFKVMAQEKGEISRRIGEYDRKLTILNEEIERLNGILRKKVDDNSNLENKNRSLVSEIDGLRRQNGEYEYKITQISQEWQSKFVTLEGRLKQFTNENDELRKRMQDQNENWRQERGKLGEYENKIALLSQEI